MAVPKRKHSNARTGSRRSQDYKKAAQTVRCTVCGKMIPSHVVCPKCGNYMGRPIVSQDK